MISKNWWGLLGIGVRQIMLLLLSESVVMYWAYYAATSEISFTSAINIQNTISTITMFNDSNIYKHLRKLIKDVVKINYHSKIFVMGWKYHHNWLNVTSISS